MNKVLAGTLIACLASFAFSGNVAAQTAPPNYGNYQSLDGNFRIGIELSAPLFGLPTRAAAFEQTTINDITRFVDPAEIAAYLNQPLSTSIYAQQGQVNGVFDLRGVPVLAGYAANSPVLTVRFVNPVAAPAVISIPGATYLTLTDSAGQPCSFTYNGANRSQSYAQFDADTSDGNTATARRMLQCLGRAWANFSPVDPLVGNPYSLQGTMVRAGLDLTSGDSLAERSAAGNGANSAGDSWVIGGAYAGGTADRYDLTRIEARIAKGWRVFAGSRARLKLDLPFNFTRIKGAVAYTGQVGLALELPVKPNWSIEPRLSYGLVYSADQGSVGHIAQGSIASRYAIGHIGRGVLTIGNMVSYGGTLKTPGSLDLNPDIKNWGFRNGLAYELPLKMRVSQHLMSVRASYVYTTFAGDKLYNNNFHEATLSLGVRGREDTPKQFRDVVRLIFSTVQAHHFHTWTAGLGFHF